MAYGEGHKTWSVGHGLDVVATVGTEVAETTPNALSAPNAEAKGAGEGERPAGAERSRELAGAAAVAAGCVFSGLLFALFLPATLAHNRRLEALYREARAQDPKVTRKEFLERSGFEDVTPLKVLNSQIAMLAPLAGGALLHLAGLSGK